MKILIIEDEEPLLESIVEYFSRENYVCEGVATFEEGQEKINLYEYDCVLLDITLPDGNGLKLLEELKVLRKMDGVIIISFGNCRSFCDIQTKVTHFNLIVGIKFFTANQGFDPRIEFR